MGNITDLELTSNSQYFFDSYNNFIMSDDTRIFNKLIARSILYQQVKNVPGDIVECGVFKGNGVFSFLKLKRLFNPNTYKKVIGFDFFDTEKLLISIKDSHDKNYMSNLFEGRNFSHGETFKEKLSEQIMKFGFNSNEFVLVEGDVINTTKEFVKSNPGFKISLLYMDLDLEEPTYETLKNLWDNITKGGIIVFDEYGYHKWSESKGVDRFIDEKGLELINLDYMCPTSYISKK